MTTPLPVRNTYDKYASKNPIERKLMGGFFDALDTALAGLAPTTILEVGAGEGEVTARVTEMFPDVGVIGMDLPDEDTRKHWAEREVTGFFGDMRRLPLPDRCADLVLGIEVLEHVPNPELALADIARVCNGTVILSVPREPIWRVANMARGKYIGDLGNTPGHLNHWSRNTFREFVASEFQVQWSASPFPWTMVKATRRG